MMAAAMAAAAIGPRIHQSAMLLPWPESIVLSGDVSLAEGEVSFAGRGVSKVATDPSVA